LVETLKAGGIEYAKKLDLEAKAADLAQKAANDPFAPGPNGTILPNKPVQDFQLSKANAGAPRTLNNINSFTPASEEAQKDFMKGLRTRYDQLQSASTVIDNIEKAKALIPSAAAFTGSGANVKLEAAKFLNNNLGTGINTEGVKSAEELNSRLFMGVMDNLKKMDSAPSQSQQAALQKGLGEIGTDPSALPRVLDVFGEIVRQKVDIHNKEAKGAVERGVKFPYDPMINLPPPKTTAPAAAPAGGVRVNSLLQADPAKYNGQVATGDDGIKYKSDGTRGVSVQ